jgi:hypothetical protein
VRRIQPAADRADVLGMFASSAAAPRVVGFTHEAMWCEAPGCGHTLPDGAALVREGDRVRHYGPACVRRTLGVAFTRTDLLAVESRRHAAFVMDLAFVHAAFVGQDADLCRRIEPVLETLAPATVAERVVLEAARGRLISVIAPVTDAEPEDAFEDA